MSILKKFKSFTFGLNCIDYVDCPKIESLFSFQTPPVLSESRAGYFLLYSLLKKFYDYRPENELFYIKKTELGKPYFENSSLCFSISHTKGYVAACISDMPVGVDIEYKKDRDFIKYSKKLFCYNEYARFLDSADKKEFFYNAWSEKESFLKCRGTGVREAMKDVVVDKEGYRVFHIGVPFDLSCCVCKKRNI